MNFQKIKLIETAAMVIKSKMKDILKSFNEYFPAIDVLNNNALFDFLWGTLKLLLEKIFVGSQPEILKLRYLLKGTLSFWLEDQEPSLHHVGGCWHTTSSSLQVKVSD